MSVLIKMLGSLQDRKGTTAIEYGLIAAGIGVAIAVIVFTMGEDLAALFTTISEKLQSAG